MFLKSVEAGLDFCLVLSSNIDNANANLIKNVFWSKCQKSWFFCFVLVHSSQVPSYSVNIKFEFNTYFYEIVKSWILLTTFKKGNITYVWQDSQYTTGNSYHLKTLSWRGSCRANQWTCLFRMGAFVMKEVNYSILMMHLLVVYTDFIWTLRCYSDIL